ncbi:MAG: putative peptidoglycan glycosyltransferase FtsW [Verrucomicrobiota bacterium]|nr:putative peptidoglycan glycosyltransferase FtsW [Verrucomicrobiota bacterium]
MKREVAVILFSVGTLAVTGALTMNSLTITHPTPSLLYNHIAYIGLGFAALGIGNLIDYRWLNRWRVPNALLVVALTLLVLVLVPGIGTEKNHARRWLLFFQPSEFAKLAIIIWLADYCARNLEFMHLRRVGFTKPVLIGGFTAVLVFGEPDWGTAVLMGLVMTAMLWVAGAPTFHLVSAGMIGIELVAHFLVRNSDKFTRILVFLDPWKFADGDGWQIVHSLLAIGSGGLLGKFIGDGTHKFGFVPEQRTDFVMSAIGEELGFVGCVLVVLLFVNIVVAGARIAWRMADPFARFLAFGITFLIGTQAFINIGVATSCLPNKGIPLPFVSYGGSNMVVALAGIGLLVNLARYAPLVPVPELPKTERKAAAESAPVFIARRSGTCACPACKARNWFPGKLCWIYKTSANESALRPWQRAPMRSVRCDT